MSHLRWPGRQADRGLEATHSLRAYRRLVLWFFLAAILMMGCVIALNVYVDPLGVSGSERYPVRSGSLLTREWKLELLQDLDKVPGTVVLGSSTARTIDPAHVESLTGQPAFNASVSGGKPIDMYALMSYLGERFEGDAFPQLIYAIDIESTFRAVDPSPALHAAPELWRQIPDGERVGLRAGLYRPYVTWQSTELSLRMLEYGPLTTPREKAREIFTADGFPLKSKQGILRDRLPRRPTQQYADLIYGSAQASQFDDDSMVWIERLVELANSHGVAPTLVIMPVHPFTEAELDRVGRVERRAEVLRRLDSLARSHDVRVVDTGDLDSFGGVPGEFLDHVHMATSNTNRLLDELDQRGLTRSVGH